MRKTLRILTLCTVVFGALAVAAPPALAAANSCTTDGPDELQPIVVRWEHESARSVLQMSVAWEILLDCRDDSYDGTYDVSAAAVLRGHETREKCEVVESPAADVPDVSITISFLRITDAIF